MQKPFKLCNKINCNNLTREKYCQTHESEQKETIKAYNAARSKDEKKFYNSKAWKVIRLAALARDGYKCVQCYKEKGITIPAEEVDHILELRDRFDLRADLDNLNSLCKFHHRKKTAAEKKRREETWNNGKQ
jgi:5-methylcytosine-specific restriction enzyme A